jgi:hypothetical protein
MLPAAGTPAKTTCPHCWVQFDPLDVLAIASHASLRGDPRVGPDEMLRFPPSVFSPDNTPLDPRGRPAPLLACPHCHLQVPEALLSLEPLFVSILGSPGCGKSFYLAGLTWEARRVLPAGFGISFADADPAANVTLNEYEKAVFLSAEPARPVALGNLIRKTQLEGHGLYSAVTYADHSVRYPRPFMFTLRPGQGHPEFGQVRPRLLCLYDNAGEQFLPGSDSASAPVTQHLARAAFHLYLFDPTMDVRFRRMYRLDASYNGTSERQELVLAEAVARIRRLKGLPAGERDNRPLIVVLTKADVWGPALTRQWEQEPWSAGAGGGLDTNRVRLRSDALRTLLAKACPEFVQLAGEVSPAVTYVPTSVLGKARVETVSGVASVRPEEIRPTGVLVPLLVGLNHAVRRLIPVKRTAPISSNGETFEVSPGSAPTRPVRR